MTSNFVKVIDREGWEACIDGHVFSLTDSIFREEQKSAIARINPAERGFAFWDKTTNQRVSLSAIGALDILMDMRQVEIWKTNGMVIGVPALTSAQQDEDTVHEEILQTPFVRQHPEHILSDALRLTCEQSEDLFDFLQENEQLLRELAEKDAVIAKQQMTALFEKIAEYGRMKRQNRSE